MQRIEVLPHQLQMKIHTYKKRREQFRLREGCHGENYRRLSSRIDNMVLALKRASRCTNEMISIKKTVEDFFGIHIHFKKMGCSRDMHLAKKIFFKWCIEHGIPGGFIAKYYGISDRNIPTLSRSRLNKLLKEDQYTIQTWRSFKLFVEDLKEDNLIS